MSVTANDIRAALLIIESEMAFIDANPNYSNQIKIKKQQKWVVMQDVIIGLCEKLTEEGKEV